MRRLLGSAAMAAILAGGSGCIFGGHSSSLSSSSFVGPQTQPAGAAQALATTQPAPAPATQASAAPATQPATPATQPVVVAQAAAPTSLPSPSTSPSASAASPDTAPATQPSGNPSIGKYMIAGTVVAESNGQPIYADKVLAKIDLPLRALARKYARDPDSFRAVARSLIGEKVMEDVGNELEFAAAERNTTDEEKQIATMVTTQYRQKEVTKAGGSLAVARARSLEDGQDFDENVNEEYRRNLIRLYYAKKIFPKVQVTVEEMRRVYERDRERLYTEKAEAKFRIIRVGFQDAGGKEEAFAKIKKALDRARAGESFGDLAAELNDSRTLFRQRGYIDVKKDEKGQMVKDEKGEPIGTSFAKGTFSTLEELEKAVFALDVGGVTGIVEADGAYYIAKLEAKKDGRVRTFADEDVQTQIRDRMEREQRDALRKKEKKRLFDSSVTRADEATVEVAVEMAMQKYATWARSE